MAQAPLLQNGARLPVSTQRSKPTDQLLDDNHLAGDYVTTRGNINGPMTPKFHEEWAMYQQFIPFHGTWIAPVQACLMMILVAVLIVGYHEKVTFFQNPSNLTLIHLAATIPIGFLSWLLRRNLRRLVAQGYIRMFHRMKPYTYMILETVMLGNLVFLLLSGVKSNHTSLTITAVEIVVIVEAAISLLAAVLITHHVVRHNKSTMPPEGIRQVQSGVEVDPKVFAWGSAKLFFPGDVSFVHGEHTQLSMFAPMSNQHGHTTIDQQMPTKGNEKKQNNSLNNHNTATSIALADVTAETQRLRARLAKLERSNAELEQREHDAWEDARNANSQLAEALEHVRTEGGDSRGARRILQQQLQELARLREVTRQQTEQLEELRQAGASATDAHARAEAEIKKLKKQQKTSQKTIINLQTALEIEKHAAKQFEKVVQERYGAIINTSANGEVTISDMSDFDGLQSINMSLSNFGHMSSFDGTTFYGPNTPSSAHGGPSASHSNSNQHAIGTGYISGPTSVGRSVSARHNAMPTVDNLGIASSFSDRAKRTLSDSQNRSMNQSLLSTTDSNIRSPDRH